MRKRLQALAEALQRQGQWLATAESCTGGLIAAAITDVPGASAWFDRGVVTYANRAKQSLLDVPEALLIAHGAVSREVAVAMADGLRRRAPVDWTLAVTGIAGPAGGSPEKPVGTVWIAWSGPLGGTTAQSFCFSGNREQIRAQAVESALDGLCRRVGVG